MHTMIPANRTARPEVDRGDDRVLHAIAGNQALPVSGHDEEGVVDTHAEADQKDQLRREDRHLHHVAQEADHPDGGPERGQGRQQREGHSEDRAEDEQKHEGGQEHTEAGPADGLAVRLLGDEAGHRHLEVRALRAQGRGYEGLGVRRSHSLVQDIERDVGKGRLLVRVDLVGNNGRVRALDGRDMGQLRHLGQHRLDGGLDPGVGHRRPVGGVEDDSLLVAGLLGRCRPEEVQRLGRLGVGELEVVRVCGADTLGQQRHSCEGGDPEQDHDAAVPYAPSGEGLHGV
jgi:hypothetical protein